MLTLEPPYAVDKVAQPGPGQLVVDSDTKCAAPRCGLPLDQHDGTARHVDLFPVVNDRCAQALYYARRPVRAASVHEPLPVRAAWVREQLDAGTMPDLIPGVPHFGPIPTTDPIFNGGNR